MYFFKKISQIIKGFLGHNSWQERFFSTASPTIFDLVWYIGNFRSVKHKTLAQSGIYKYTTIPISFSTSFSVFSDPIIYRSLRFLLSEFSLLFSIYDSLYETYHASTMILYLSIHGIENTKRCNINRFLMDWHSPHLPMDFCYFS